MTCRWSGGPGRPPEGVTEGFQLVTGPIKVIRDPSTGEVLDRFIEQKVTHFGVPPARFEQAVRAAGDERPA